MASSMRSPPGVRYSGSLLKYSFAEATHEKGALLVEVDRGSARVERIPLGQVRDVARIQGKIDDLLSRPDLARHQGDLVEATLEDTDYVRCVPLADGVWAYLFSGPDRAVAAVTSWPPHAGHRLPTSADVQRFDLFGNPIAAGAAIDEHVSYVVCNAGLAKLQAALGVK